MFTNLRGAVLSPEARVSGEAGRLDPVHYICRNNEALSVRRGPRAFRAVAEPVGISA